MPGMATLAVSGGGVRPRMWLQRLSLREVGAEEASIALTQSLRALAMLERGR